MNETGPREFRRAHLFALGFATLFVELALIRYLAGNIWNLGYFPNFVLIGVFVGMGLGFVLHRLVDERRSVLVYAGAAALLFVLVVFVSLLHPSMPGFGAWQGIIAGELYFTATREGEEASPLLFVVWFVLVVAVFAAISQRTAKVFRAFAPLTAYTADIAGALLGIIAFATMSFLRAPAWVWFGVAAPLVAYGAATSRVGVKAVAAMFVLLCGGVAAVQDRTLLADPKFQGELTVRWSPYQKLEYVEGMKKPVLFANGLVHQVLLPEDELREQLYMAPYQYRADTLPDQPYRRVLIIGGGTGNDAAAALAHGAEHVDVVEIDPAIAALGREKHPLEPYDDPRVRVHIDDGRAFMNGAEGKYDLVIFALTDSVVKVSAVAQLRLENFLFTRESIARAASLLSPTGNLVLYNYYRTDWLVEKIRQMLREGTGREPEIVAKNGDMVVLLVGAGAPPAHQPTAALDVPTDDWPFLYLQERGMPSLYVYALLGMVGLVALLLVLVHRASRRRAGEGDDEPAPLSLKLAFLGMGTAFLLLETKSVVQFSLLFGVTWHNAALVFVGVLSLVLLANRTVPLLPGDKALWPVYGLLIGSCLLGVVFPLDALLSVESVPLRATLAVLLMFTPIYFANVLFGLTFARQKAAEHLFGWNLIGSTLGGAVEYACMATGYQALSTFVALLYSLVFLLLLSSMKRRAGAPAQG